VDPEQTTDIENKENTEPNVTAPLDPEVLKEMDQEDVVVSYSFDKLIEEDESSIEAETITERMPSDNSATNPLSFGDLIDEAETAEQSEGTITEPVLEVNASHEALNTTVEHIEEIEAPRTSGTSLSFADLIEEDEIVEGDGTLAVTPIKVAPPQAPITHQTDFDFHTVDDEIQRICSDVSLWLRMPYKCTNPLLAGSIELVAQVTQAPHF